MKHFTIYESRYWESREGSEKTYAKAGILDNPNGNTEPGVMIFRGRFLASVLTSEDAIRLSNELIDAAESPVC